MKKVIFILLALCAVVVFVLWSTTAEESQSVTEKVSFSKSAKQIPESLVKQHGNNPANKADESNNPKLELNSANQTKELSCFEKYRQKPEWKDIEAIVGSIYMSGEEAAGEGVYQQIPLDAVKSYADAGDANAMFHFGSETMWNSSFGLYFNPINQNPGNTTKERQEKAQQHKVDLEAFHKGANYAYRAAVHGKLGGILEVSLVSKSVLRKMVRSQRQREDIEEFLIHRHAYLNLLEQVHKNDSELLLFFQNDEEIKGDLTMVYGVVGPDSDTLERIKTDIDERSLKLRERWESDRLSLGLEPYPDVIPERLDSLLEEMKNECR
ncbi:hypothetical protein [Kangiella marina]|uniref:Uncharacterized protein n=1 Tax=Kangiella marina TaxID=1079178 RepID=A0ABP8ILU8_9GAMM